MTTVTSNIGPTHGNCSYGEMVVVQHCVPGAFLLQSAIGQSCCCGVLNTGTNRNPLELSNVDSNLTLSDGNLMLNRQTHYSPAPLISGSHVKNGK